MCVNLGGVFGGLVHLRVDPSRQNALRIRETLTRLWSISFCSQLKSKCHKSYGKLLKDVEAIKKFLAKEFQVKDLEEAKYILEIRIC